MCKHTPQYPEPHAAPSVDAALALCDVVETHEAFATHPLAVTLPEDGRTKVDAAFWAKCGPCQRACVVAHERSHVILGLDCPCESCADKVGGFLMRLWGYTVDAIEAGFDSLNVRAERQVDGTLRDAGENAREGASAAGRELAARGLLGQTITRESLLKSAAKPATATQASVGRTAPPTANTSPGNVAAPKADASRTVKVTDPSFVKDTGHVVIDDGRVSDGAFSTAVKAQVVAGIIVAVVIALVIGRRS